MALYAFQYIRIEMLSKIIKHWREGDLKRVVNTYLSNITVLHKIEAWRKLKAKGEAVVIGAGNGISLKLYPDSILSEPIFTGRFEPSEIDFVKSYLKKGDTFLDIGANIGLFTVIAAGEVKNEGRVVSFEPVQKTFSRLRENVELNKFRNVELVNAGLSDSDGTLEMITSTDGHDAWNSFGRPTAGTHFKSESVNIKRFDTWLFDSKLSEIHLVKMDVEGWEINVLRGGMQFFSSPDAPDLLVEFTEENCKNAGTSCGELYETLANAGYTMYTYDQYKKRLIPEARRQQYTHLNIIATKNPQNILARIKA
jgi:FkbM family methyltransferase